MWYFFSVIIVVMQSHLLCFLFEKVDVGSTKLDKQIR